ncbi:MAG: glycosyltransferase [Candidatus Obscuribacterales bacterium]|nr:glycosyltransferase [Candidatus Obscuribacterales bacterium]
MPPFSRRILLVTLEPIAKQMAGPAIRCVEIGKQLAKEHTVTIFSPYACKDAEVKELNNITNLTLACGINKSQLYKLAQEHDVIFVQANVLKPYPALAELDKYFVVDLYDPYLLAVLAQFSDDDASASASYRLMHKILERHMVKADFSICASEKQLDYWLGRFCALGRLTPELYAFDRSFRKIIDIVPFGLPETSPERTGPAMRGRVAGIEQSDFILLWGGGLWEWFDPLTVIKAVGLLANKHPQLKLYFMGFKSPNPQVPLMKMALKAKELANELGLTDKHVFFCDSWTPYEERVNYLLDADVAVSAHFDLPETRFSFRTRILDYLWAGLPVLTSTGDQLAELIEKKQAGIALPYEDAQAWANAIESLLLDSKRKAILAENSHKLSLEFQWNKVVKPLSDYCANPHHLPVYKKVKMPTLVERAKAVYSRGGKELISKRSAEIIKDFMRG